MTWFLLQNDEICGPFETAHVYENCDSETLIWGPGMDEWSLKSDWQAYLKQPKKAEAVDAKPVTEVAEEKVDLQQPQNLEDKSVEEVAEIALGQFTEKWFYAYDGKRFGPLNQSNLILKVSSLEKPEEVLLWKKGENNWQPLFKFPKILAILNEKLSEKQAA